jgi:hypothetical protein
VGLPLLALPPLVSLIVPGIRIIEDGRGFLLMHLTRT